jgi:hypothetical protein
MKNTKLIITSIEENICTYHIYPSCTYCNGCEFNDTLTKMNVDQCAWMWLNEIHLWLSNIIVNEKLKNGKGHLQGFCIQAIRLYIGQSHFKVKGFAIFSRCCVSFNLVCKQFTFALCVPLLTMISLAFEVSNFF